MLEHPSLDHDGWTLIRRSHGRKRLRLGTMSRGTYHRGMRAPFRVLFICTANACRSQMAEAVLRHLGGQRFLAASAGICPMGQIHPLAMEALRRRGLSFAGQSSKSFEDLLEVEQDIIITVCDAAACVIPPRWAGNPIVVHWGLPDPVTTPGTLAEKHALADTTVDTLVRWIGRLIELRLEDLSRTELERELNTIPRL
ncbi:MAG: arsenate reductase ArsC [Phycisphaerae bacterium]|nr:arsenate reductase ArsC [Phycisphaerae bacterium]